MWRIYFIVGDLAACTVTGAGAALAVQSVIPGDWPVALGMVAGMGLGLLAGVIGALVFTPLFGALEVMLPASLSAMVAGTASGMAQTVARGSGGIGWSEAALGGALAGLACFAFTALLQAMKRGEVEIREVK